MLLFIKNYSPAIVWASVIAFLSLTASSNLPKLDWDFLAPDKFGHFSVYAILNIACLWGVFKQKSENKHTYICTTIFAAAYGVFMEYMQYFLTPDRQFEYPDMLANALGALLGLVLFHFFIKRIL